MGTTDLIEGYEITIGRHKDDRTYKQVKTVPLRLNRTGGAHILSPDDLTRLIEDAVFKEEQSSE